MLLIDKIGLFFDTYDFPNKPHKLKEGETIINQKLFVESHIAMVKGESSRELRQPYFDRLNQFYNQVKTSNI